MSTIITESTAGTAAGRNAAFAAWNENKRILLRFFFIYFVIQAIPLDWKFYRDLFSVNWLHGHFHDLFVLTRYEPRFLSEDVIRKWGLSPFVNWGIIFLIAVAGTAGWTWYARTRKKDYNNYSELYYWLRVILRFRLAIGIIAYGLIKLFPLQMPYPSLSNLHTNYGDFLAWKIYYQTIGIVPWYESFLGFVEIAAGLLLIARSTATFGAGILLGFIGNVLAANFAYDIGEEVYSVYLTTIALFLLAYDVPRLYSLLITRKFTLADRFHPLFRQKWLQRARVGLKGAFILFILSLGYKTYSNYKEDAYLLPSTPGLPGSVGYYRVREFVINHDTIPWSLTDPNRWQDVVFEKWATLSVKIAGPVKLDRSPVDIGVQKEDLNRDYELAGAGGRTYYAYKTDTVQQTLSLQNKNPNYRGNNLLLHYSRPDSSTILLTGVNEKKDSLYIVLNKVEKKYMLFEGRRKPLTL